jgi:triosephosphate isomerase (TIM)
MRKKIVAGNWKMNASVSEGKELFKEILNSKNQAKGSSADLLIIAPSFVHLAVLADLNKNSEVFLAAQNSASKESGAFTGEVSPLMVKSAGAEYVILGHSERRQYFKESAEELKLKVDLALKEGLKVIFCCGESLSERENNSYFQTITSQLESSLFHLSKGDFKNIIIAYEPVWAIGTGITAKPNQAQEMHQHIRTFIKSKYGEDTAENISILYGGSCNASNAKEIFSNPDVDGGLIGGASLKAEDFISIYNSF